MGVSLDHVALNDDVFEIFLRDSALAHALFGMYRDEVAILGNGSAEG